MDFFSASNLGAYKMMFHLLDYLMEDVRRLQDTSVLNSSVCGQFTVHIREELPRDFYKTSNSYAGDNVS